MHKIGTFKLESLTTQLAHLLSSSLNYLKVIDFVLKYFLLIEMELAEVKFVVGQAVYAKLKGYPPWPAIITHIPKNRKIARVQYFNSSQWSELSFVKLTPFHAGKQIVEKYIDKNRPFTKAFHEMRMIVERSKKVENFNSNQIPKIIIRLLTPIEIKSIQKELKANAKTTKTEANHRLRSGRQY